MVRAMFLLFAGLLLIGCTGQATGQFPTPATPANDEAAFRTLAHRLLARRSDGAPAPEEIQILPGQLPERLAVDIPLPDDAWILGSLTRGGEETEIVLDVNQTVDQIFDFYRRELAAKGWVVFDYPTEGGFVPGIGRTGLTFCSEADNATLWVGAFEVVDGPTDVRLNLRTEPRLASCVQDPGAPEHPIPLLEDPSEAWQVTAGFGGSTDSFNAEVVLKTELDAATLEIHYADQLEAAGWLRRDGEQAGPLVWSVWQTRDEAAREWEGLLLVMEMTEVPDRCVVYLRVDLVS